MNIESLIRTIPDYPKRGVMFRDITTLLQDAKGLVAAVDRLAEPFRGLGIQKVAGIEARGFILGGAVAVALGAGFVLVRKKGKLPWDTISADYDLEYGSDGVEMHTDSVAAGERVLVVDDLIATGGTAEATIRIIEKVGGSVAGCAVIIDLPDLGGRRRIEATGHKVVSLCEFQGD
jgi:adenine phosphoribosyltransferase